LIARLIVEKKARVRSGLFKNLTRPGEQHHLETSTDQHPAVHRLDDSKSNIQVLSAPRFSLAFRRQPQSFGGSRSFF
jgi:hypothetical protein